MSFWRTTEMSRFAYPTRVTCALKFPYLLPLRVEAPLMIMVALFNRVLMLVSLRGASLARDRVRHCQKLPWEVAFQVRGPGLGVGKRGIA